MNRSILIVICDFLLVSLLAFSTVDINKTADEGSRVQAMPRLEMATNDTAAAAGRDLTAVMRVALDEEQRNRELLLSELRATREKLSQEQANLSEREKQVLTFQQQLQSREQLANSLQQEQGTLQQRLTEAQTTLQNLNQRLQSASTEATTSRERLNLVEAEAKKQTEQTAALQKQLEMLQQSNQVVLAEKQQLATQLQVAEVERRHATQQVAQIEQQVKVEREEKARLAQQAGQLAEGVKTLASKSGELVQEIRENRPLAPNTVYSQYLSNRVRVHISALRSGALGMDASKRKDSETVLVTSGTNLYALLHVEDTPLTLWDPGTDWEGLAGTLTRGSSAVPIRSVIFALRDPRVVLVPVPQSDAKQLGASVYRVSSEPYKFQDAVLVGQAGYYGECKFQIDPSTRGYVKLDNSFVRGLFGKFNPSRGDLVFSKMGELLGVMANSTYCLMLEDFHGAATLRFAQDVRNQRTGIILSQLYSSVVQMPSKLQ